MNNTLQWSEALEAGIPEMALRHALAHHRHYHDDGEVFWLLSNLAEVLDLIALEGRDE
jgi:hypothetical protein